MADISQTAANVAMGGASTPQEVVQFGEAVTQGQPLYQSTDGKFYRCDANDGLVKAACKAIALTPGATNGYGLVAKPATTPGRSLVNLGATLAVGEVYAVSATVGRICPVADLASTQFVTVIGVAISTSLLDFQVAIGTVAKA